MIDFDDSCARHCKTVIVGEMSTGKTSIIYRYLEGQFKESYNSTLSPTNTSKLLQLEQGGILLDIWDTAGQEKYRGINKLFYNDAQIAILVYDITNKKSFEELKSYWIDQIKQSCSKKVVIGIAGNKSDLFEKAEVTQEEGELFASEHGAIHVSISCLQNFGIDSLFETLAKKFLEIEEDEFVEDNEMNHKLTKKKSKHKKRFC